LKILFGKERFFSSLKKKTKIQNSEVNYCFTVKVLGLVEKKKKLRGGWKMAMKMAKRASRVFF